jgi:hypothetical protein
MSNIDQNHYDKLADWAESDAPAIHPDRGSTGAAAADASRDILRRAGGRPSLDLDSPAGTSPRRQVRLPRALSDRIDELADNDNRSPSDLMREAIANYVNTRDHQQAG